MMTTAKRELAELRIGTHYARATNEDDDPYYYENGFVIAALVDGIHCFEFQEVFSTWEAANGKLNILCGDARNGFKSEIDTTSGDDPNNMIYEWQYIGSSR